MVFASHTVQVTSEAKASPIITAFTTMSALRNMPHGDRLRGSSEFGSLRERGLDKRVPCSEQSPTSPSHARPQLRVQFLPRRFRAI